MLQSLLSSPEPKDPQDAEVAAMMLKRPEEYTHKAREWAVIHAGAKKRDEGQGSGGATAETLRRAAQVAKDAESKAKSAELVCTLYSGSKG